MYKVLIVDDEPLVQVGIKSMINWTDAGFEVIGTAMNGSAALSIIEAQRPDLVITDIKMPVMDGLELVRICREKYGSTFPHFIILTSYEEFQLAKKALTFGVSDYLVKLELTPEALKASVDNVLSQLKDAGTPPADNSSLVYPFRDKFFIRLLNSLFDSEEQFLLQCREVNLSFDSDSYTCCTGELTGDIIDTLPADRQLAVCTSSLQMLGELAEKYMPCHCIALDIRHFAVIFCGQTDSGRLKSILTSVGETIRKYYNISFICGIGSPAGHPMAIGESYQNARLALLQADAENPISACAAPAARSAGHDSFNIAVFKKSLSKAFDEYDSEELTTLIDSLCVLFLEHPSDYVQALDAASGILYLAISLLQDGEEVISDIFSDVPDGYRSLYRRNGVEQIVRWLKTLEAGLCETFETRRRDHKSLTVSGVKKYILEHIRERLSLNEVAAAFGISPNYLSQLFGKYSDTGFSEYVNSCKIRESKQLLDTGSYKVYEVADLMGFESSFYFSKVFKRIEGISPTDYLNTKFK